MQLIGISNRGPLSESAVIHVPPATIGKLV